MAETDHDFRLGFTVETQGLDKGFDRAKSKMKLLETQTRQAGERINSAFGAGIGGLSGIAASFSVVTNAAQTALQSIQQVARATAELAVMSEKAEKASRYFDDVMGPLSDRGREWADGLADSYGLYTSDVESYMGSLMEAFQRAGNGMSESFRMAKDFTQLSWDLSAYFPNYSLDQIQEMLLDLARGGGEEALEKIASGLDGDALKAHAVAMGIAEIGEELTVLQKQQAAHDILMTEHGSLKGLYGETDNATTALDRMNSSAKDLKETIGGLLSPAVEFFAELITEILDSVNEKIETVRRNIDRFIGTIRDGVNWISGKLGMGDVWTVESEAATQSTKALEGALANVEKAAAGAKNAMEGLAGFDRLYTVKDTGDEKFDAGEMGDWEKAFDEWLGMFVTRPDIAIDKMDPVWDSMLEANVDNIGEFREMFGDYFDWIVETELSDTKYTQDQKQAILDDLLEYMFSANQSYQEQLKKLEDEYNQLEKEAEIGNTETTLEQIQAMREDAIQDLKESYQLNMLDTFATVLEKLGLATRDEIMAMQLVFDTKVKEIESVYDKVFECLKQQMSDLNRQIASAEAELEQKKEQSSSKGFWQNLKDEITNPDDNEFWKNLGVGDGVGRFAQGGLFPPNSPQLVVMGDNAVEPEVAAPRSMIEDAVYNVFAKVGGLSSSPQQIVLEVPITLDGREIARGTYKYLVQEGKRRGKTAGFV